VLVFFVWLWKKHDVKLGAFSFFMGCIAWLLAQLVKGVPILLASSLELAIFVAVTALVVGFCEEGVKALFCLSKPFKELTDSDEKAILYGMLIGLGAGFMEAVLINLGIYANLVLGVVSVEEYLSYWALELILIPIERNMAALIHGILGALLMVGVFRKRLLVAFLEAAFYHAAVDFFAVFSLHVAHVNIAIIEVVVGLFCAVPYYLLVKKRRIFTWELE